MSKQKAKTQTTKAKTRPSPTPKIMVLFGYSDDGKPRAAKFYEPEFGAARKAADLMKLSVHEGETKKLRRTLRKIAFGDIFKSGWAGIPKIQQAQYDALVRKLTGKAPARVGAPTPTGYPKDWEHIEIGHVVLAPVEDGFYRGVVTGITGEMLAITLLDYPEEKGKRHRTAVGLCFPPTE